MTTVTLGRERERPAPPHRLRTTAGSPEVRAAVGRLSAGELCVDLELVVRRPSGSSDRLQARHGLNDGRVTALATALGPVVEVAEFDVSRWHRELARSVQVSVPSPAPLPPVAGLALSWELLVGTGAALARHRRDVYDELLARAGGSVRADDVVLDSAGGREQVQRLHHSVLGRMRAVGMARVGTGDRVGWVSWLLYADGWRALTPYSESGRAFVRFEPRRPLDLGVDVARWAAGAQA